LRTDKRSRLTFGELLLTTAIVAVLASLLLPAFARARDQARQAVCLANIKTICAAINMYRADNDQHFPSREVNPEIIAYFDTYPGGGGLAQWDPTQPGREPHCHRVTGANPYLRWAVILDSYLPSREVWRCPNAFLERGAFFINPAPDWVAHLKAYEGQWGRETSPFLCPTELSWPAGWGGEVTDSVLQRRGAVPMTDKGRTASPGMFRQSIGTTEQAVLEPMGVVLDDPAWFVVCADGGATIHDFCTGTLAYPDLCGLECAGEDYWWADWENCAWSRRCGANVEMLRNPELRKPYARHFGGVNIGFLDGHARWLNSEEVIRESPSHGDHSRGRLRGYGPWGPTSDAPWYDPAGRVPTLY